MMKHIKYDEFYQPFNLKFAMTNVWQIFMFTVQQAIPSEDTRLQPRGEHPFPGHHHVHVQALQHGNQRQKQALPSHF